MTPRDAAAVLRKVSALRALCLRLPHAATPAEQERLRRFEALVAAAQAATDADIEALAAGWRRWWLSGQSRLLLAMARKIPAALVERDLRLAGYLQASRMREFGEHS